MAGMKTVRLNGQRHPPGRVREDALALTALRDKHSVVLAMRSPGRVHAGLARTRL
jgi:hypothetical protein